MTNEQEIVQIMARSLYAQTFSASNQKDREFMELRWKELINKAKWHKKAQAALKALHQAGYEIIKGKG